MSTYDSSAATSAWFEAALSAMNPGVRWRAIRLLEDVEIPVRSRLLEECAKDPDPRVAAMAITVAAGLALGPLRCDLLESDFADAGHDEAMEWEWEYRFVVCEGLYVPRTRTIVWTRDEDDEVARGLAQLKAGGGIRRSDRVAILTGKWFVNRYTRSARSLAEARRWRARGRPRYDESDAGRAS